MSGRKLLSSLVSVTKPKSI